MTKVQKIRNDQHGFTAIEIIIVIVVLLVIGLITWRVYDMNQSNKQNKLVSGPLTAEDRKKLETSTKDAVTATTTPGQAADTPASTGTTGTSTTTTTPKTTTPSPTTTTKPTTPTTTPAPAPAPETPSTITRPTTAFCQQKNGDTFTNAWVTDNRSYTYQVWENGGWVNKTETGTAALNYDTMKVVGVIPYLKQAKWASCSDKAGYIMFYYQPAGSVNTYNWLVPFEHISVTQP